MADVLKYDEGIVLPDELKPLEEMKPQSVVFVFSDNTIPPIACDLDYLYKTTRQTTEYPADNVKVALHLDPETGNATVKSILPTNFYSDTLYKDVVVNGVTIQKAEYLMSVRRDWNFLTVIKNLAFKYGLKYEFYKNIHGKWIDMGTVRPHLALLNPANGIFWSILAYNTISDIGKETSIYTKLCDNRNFSTEGWSKFRLNDMGKIPEIDYITSDGTYHKIAKGDGQYMLDDIPVSVFEESGQSYKDNVHTKDDSYAKFVVRLGNHVTHEIGSGNINANDHHKYDDLYVTFFKADGTTPFTDLDDMLIVCNNMIVDYQRSTSVENGIFIPNVIKYADLQRTSCYNAASGYLNKTISPLQLNARKNKNSYILDFDIPNTEYGYSYKFEMRMYKWKGVKVSHFIEPLTYDSMLKKSKIEANKMFWLKSGATFGSKVEKDKCILLCGNEIVPKSNWEVDRLDSNRIKILNLEQEFDILYSEIYNKMQKYMEVYGHLNDENKPRVEDFIDENGKSYDQTKTPAERFQAYIDAAQAYRDSSASALPYDIHFAPSSFDTVKRQFLYKQFSLIRFDTAEDANFEVEVYENHSDMEVDKPYTNHIRNKHWSPDDIVVVNGLVHTFVNVYADVFTPPTKWYLPKLNNVFENADVYKLQVKKHSSKSNFYLRLNYTELLAGPLEGYSYFTYNDKKDMYLPVNISEGFQSEYIRISSGVTFDKDTVYFTKDVEGNFVRVPSSISEFEDGVTYYTRRFKQTYYVLKK